MATAKMLKNFQLAWRRERERLLKLKKEKDNETNQDVRG